MEQSKMNISVHQKVMRKNWKDPKFREAQRLGASKAMNRLWKDHRQKQSDAISRGKIESNQPLGIILGLLRRNPGLKEQLLNVL